MSLGSPTKIKPAFFVDTPEALDRFSQEWLHRIDDEIIALDIEEERGEHYHPRVALIQLSVGDDDAILDPIALGTSTLEPAMEQILLTAQQIILHGGRNDIAGLRRDFGLAPRALVDTQIAARFLGEPRFGLSSLLDERFGIHLSKEQRRSNWGQRPLTTSQLHYAQRDTIYLQQLWDVLSEDIERSGWKDAVDEECEALRQTEADRHVFDPLGWMGIKGLAKQDETTRKRASRLWWWRDQVGRRSDLHPSHVLPKWALEQAAVRGIEWLKEHRKIRHKLERIEPEAIETIHETMEKPLDLPIERQPVPNGHDIPVSPDVLRVRYDALHSWRKQAAKKTGLDPGWLAPRSILEQVARSCPEELPTLAETSDVRSWRIERYADDWRALLKKHR